MFCGKCGAQNLEDATFCKECGALLNNASSTGSAAETVQTNQATGKRNRIIGIAAVAVAALVVIILAVSIFGGRSYKSAVNEYVEASFTADGKTMVSLMPDEVVENACEDTGMTKSEFTEYLTEALQESLEYYDDYFDNWSYSYEIIETEDYSKEALKSLKEDYADEFDVSVKAAKIVTVEVTITADEENTFTNSLEVKVIKVGGSWYVDVPSMSGLL